MLFLDDDRTRQIIAKGAICVFSVSSSLRMWTYVLTEKLKMLKWYQT